MRKIGYAIIGFGGIAESRIAKEGFGADSSRFAGHPTATLVGVTDADMTRKDAASRLGLRWYDSTDAVLADPDVEAVFIATNNRSHAPLAEQALRAGRHCLIEKPISTTLEDARRVQELARRFAGKGPLISSVAALIVVLEFLSVPVAGSSTELPEFYHTMASDSESYAILDFKWDANYLMHAQTVHGKPLVGGWLARLPEDQARYLNQGSLEQVITYLLLGERAATVADPSSKKTKKATNFAGYCANQVRRGGDCEKRIVRGVLSARRPRPAQRERFG